MNLIPWRNKRRGTDLARTTPDWPISAFSSEMERMFDWFIRQFRDVGGGLPIRAWEDWPERAGAWMPAFDVAEGEKEITVRAELPGVDPKDVNVTISGNVLTVSGEKKETKEEKSGAFFRSERRFGRFQRSVELPPTADPNKVTAEHANGVLTITVQRNPAAFPKKVSVITKR